jgi:hypothetical protein
MAPLSTSTRSAASKHRGRILKAEKCADIAATGGLEAVSQPGHAWTDDAQRLERYRQLAAAGTKAIGDRC